VTTYRWNLEQLLAFIRKREGSPAQVEDLEAAVVQAWMDTMATADLYPRTVAALSIAPEHYRLSSLRYDLSKLRAKGLVEKLPHSRRYRLLPQGYRICLVFLKLFERIYAPLTAGLLQPVRSHAALQHGRLSQLDTLYQHVVEALDRLLQGVGLKAA